MDLELSLSPRPVEGSAWRFEPRDCAFLVRLHGEPLAIAWTLGDPRTLSEAQLARAIWEAVEQPLRRHLQRKGCAAAPMTAAALGELRDSSPSCPNAVPRSPSGSVAVIVPTVGRADRLDRCLRSLLAQSHSAFELIVVDNRPDASATRDLLAAVAERDARVRYVAEPRVGSSVARNRGTSEAKADLIAFTDDDVVVDGSWLTWLLDGFADTAVTATCGLVLPMQLETEAQKEFERFAGFSKGMERRAYDVNSQDTGGLLYPFFGDVFGSGNSMAFRRSELIATGGFDPALGGGSPARSGEDICAFSDAVLRGGTLVYEPRATCWHEHRRDRKQLREQIFDYGVGLGAILTKAAISRDLRFYSTIARGLRQARTAGAVVADAGVEEADAALVRELRRTQRAGALRGPVRYLNGIRQARKNGFDSAK